MKLRLFFFSIILLVRATNAQIVVPTCGQPTVAAFSVNPTNLTNPSYSVNPGALQFSSLPIILSAGNYTLYTTGLNSQNTMTTLTTAFVVTITPAPLIAISATQVSCSSTLAAVSVTPFGSASIPSVIMWSPFPVTINSFSTIGTYLPPSGQMPMNVSVTVTDPIGCKVTGTIALNPAPIPVQATVQSVQGTNSITCFNPSITLFVNTNYSNNPSTLTYAWTSPNILPTAASSIIVTQAGPYFCLVTETVSGCASIANISIVSNTTAPTTTVTPQTQMINCNMSAMSTSAIVQNAGSSFVHHFISPLGGTYIVSNQSNATYIPFSPGTYTHVLTNNVNGCKTAKSLTVVSNQGFPTFSLSSPQNFMLGCNSKSVATINILNASGTNSLQVPNGGPVSYTLLAPGFSTVISNGPLSPNSTYTLTAPGTWTAVTMDNVSQCVSRVPFTVLSNTTGPSISVAAPSIITCDNPISVLNANSTHTNVNYWWSANGSTISVMSKTLAVSMNTAAPTQTIVGSYEFSALDNNNLCKTSTTVPVVQNTFPPNAQIFSNSTEITCANAGVVLTNVSTTGIPQNLFPNNLAVIGYLWQGPSSSTPLQNSQTFTASVPGIYTLTAKDLNNGCTANKSILITDGRVYPEVYSPASAFVINCPNKAPVIINPVYTNTLNTYQYIWQMPPSAPAAFSSTNASILTNFPGIYTVTVTDQITKCATSVTIALFECVSINEGHTNANIIQLAPNPSKGRLTLTVNHHETLLNLEIVDLSGNLVYVLNLPSNQTEIDVQFLSAGIYFFKVYQSTGMMEVKKIVILK